MNIYVITKTLVLGCLFGLTRKTVCLQSIEEF